MIFWMDLDLKDKRGFIGFSYAWNGLKIMAKEPNFRIHMIATLLVTIAGFYFKLNAIEWAVIVIVIGTVLISETFNSVVEQMIDYIKPEIHPTAKLIKDMSAGGVLLASVIAIIVGVIIFLPKIIHIWS